METSHDEKSYFGKVRMDEFLGLLIISSVFVLHSSEISTSAAKGEMCNRLARGTRIVPVGRKGDWVKITWRKGKKKGWIFYPNPSIKIT